MKLFRTFLTYSILIVLLIYCFPDSGMTQTEYLRHPSGLEFQYPTEWNVNEATFADVELVPPDQSMSAHGPTEAYFLWGLGFDPSKPTQEQVTQQLKELIEQIASFLKSVGDPEAFLGKKVQGLVYTYEGKRPDGFEVRARAFVLPEKDVAFALVALGLRESILKREAIVSDMFGTFILKKVPADPKLTGLWISTPESELTQAQTTPFERNEIQLDPDGSFMTVIQSSNSEEVKNTVNSGHWYSKGNKLYFVSPGNLGLMFRYELQGEPHSRKLTLIHSNGDKQELHEFDSKAE